MDSPNFSRRVFILGGLAIVGTPDGFGSFANPITGVNGALVQSQIISPNFSIPRKTGWGILKNGNAYFFNITATGEITATEFVGTDFVINSLGAYFYSGTPANGDLIATITNEPVGSTDPYGNATYPGISSYNETLSTIAQLYDGQLLLFGPGTGVGSGAQADLYAGPQTYLVSGGALTIGGAAALSNTAAVMNLYDSGAGDGTPVVEINNAALTLGNIGTVPTTPPQNSAAMYGNPGYLKYISSQDGNAYKTGRLAVYSTGTQTISSTGQTPIAGLSLPVVAGSYRFRAVIPFTGSAANDAYLTLGGPAASEFNATIMYLGNGLTTIKYQTSIGVNTGLNSAALAAATNYVGLLEGHVIFTAPGNLVIDGASSANAATYVTQSGCILEMWPDN